MTRPSKERLELLFVEEAAKRLCKSWSPVRLPHGKGPDFLVAEGEYQFGLEVVQVFAGQISESGSFHKRAELKTQRAIDARQREYEATTNVSLRVALVGDLCRENLAKVVPALLEQNLQWEPVGHPVVLDIDTGLRAGLRAHVMKSVRPEWFSVMDRVGWVDSNAMPRIEAIVREKSQKLPLYMKAAGSDVRLLVVSDRIYNSGKLTLERPTSLDKKGFRAVYFFSYPENVVSF